MTSQAEPCEIFDLPDLPHSPANVPLKFSSDSTVCILVMQCNYSSHGYCLVSKKSIKYMIGMLLSQAKY